MATPFFHHHSAKIAKEKKRWGSFRSPHPTLLVVLFLWIGICSFAPRVWAAEQKKPVKQPISSKRLMELAGIGPTQWAQFADSLAWNEKQEATLQKILLRLAQLPVDVLERMATPIDWNRFIEDPTAYQGTLTRLRGKITSVEVVRLPKELAQRFDVDEYYRVTMDMEPSGSAVVLARSVPKTWQKGGTIDEPGGAWAMFVKVETQRPIGQTVPVFAAAWVEVFAHQRLLGRLGVDTGLLDDLVDRKPWQPKERECFYQVLAAVSRMPQGELQHEAVEQLKQKKQNRYSVEPLFNQPEEQRGKLVLLTGTARRVLRVIVDDPDIQRRFGIDHYYEVYLFTDDSQGNPIVCCMAHLAEGMQTGEGPNFAEPVRVAGFFLKTWAYPLSKAAKKTDEDRAIMQLAPLVVGREAVRVAQQPTGGMSIWGPVTGAAFVLVLLVIWIWLLQTARNDRQFRRHLGEKADRSDRAPHAE